MAEQLTIVDVSADTLNSDLHDIVDAVNLKAEINGDDTQRFKVADAVDPTDAVNKRQLESSIGFSDVLNMPEMNSVALTGTVTTTAGSAIVTGAGTNFTAECPVGTIISIPGAYYACTVLSVSSDTSLTLSNAVTKSYSGCKAYTNKVSFSSGVCLDDTLNVKIIASAMTKTLSAFSSGTNNGMLDTGSCAASSKYAVFVISKADGTSDYLASLSKTSPIMPTGYVYKRRIGWILTNPNGHIITFVFNSDASSFIFTNQILDLSIYSPVPTYTDLSISCPPNKVPLLLIAAYPGSNQNTELDLMDKVSGVVTSVLSPAGTNCYSFLETALRIKTDSDSKIWYKLTGAASIGGYVFTQGFIDRRLD